MTHVADITFDSTKVSADLTDYPAYIDLSNLPLTEFWGSVLNGGGDIRCYLAGGVTELPREIVFCDTATDTGEMHVKIPTLSSSVDTVIEVHTDGASSEPAATAPNGRNAVWSDYEMVVHGHDLTTESSAGKTLTQNNTPQISTTVPWGDGNSIHIDASTTGLFCPIDLGTLYPFTMQGWGALNNSANTPVVGVADSSQFDRQINIRQVTADQTNMNIAADSGFTSSNGSSWTGEWAMLHAVCNSSTSRPVYRDGASTPDFTSTVARTPAGINRAGIGVSADSTPFGGGNASPATSSIKEVRIRDTALSTDWIGTEYNNQSSAATFYTATAAVVGVAGKVIRALIGGAWTKAVPHVLISGVWTQVEPHVLVGGAWLASGETDA